MHEYIAAVAVSLGGNGLSYSITVVLVFLAPLQ